MYLNRKMKVIYSSLNLNFNACGGPCCFAPQLIKPFYNDLVVKVNVISVAKLMENILKDDPGTVSLQLDG